MMAKDAELQTKKQRQRNRKPVCINTTFLCIHIVGGTENAGREIDGPIRRAFAGREIAGHENAGHEIAEQKIQC